MGLFDSVFTNLFGDAEVAGKSPDTESDFYRGTDMIVDKNYWHERFCDMLISMSQNSSKEFFIIYGGEVTDAGAGTIDISEGVAIGKDDNGDRRLIYMPALSGLAFDGTDIPVAWKDDRQIWIIGKYDHKLGSSTRNHYVGTNYHYQMEDTYFGGSNGLDSGDSLDMFLDADPGDTMIIWGSFQMSAGNSFTNLERERTRTFQLNENNGVNIIRDILVSNWTERAPTVAKNIALYDVCWSPELSLFCGVGFADGADAYIVTSPDGITWTERAPAVAKNIVLNSVCWSAELTLFCAVGRDDGADAYILTSPDGTTWTERAPTVAKNLDLEGVCWSAELTLFVAVGENDGAEAYILTSPDGTTWTERAGGTKNKRLYGVCWSAELTLFCAVGVNDGVDDYILTSPDGTTWTERANPASVTLARICWSLELGLFCAVGGPDGTDAEIYTSPDGTTWTERANPKNKTLRGVCWSPELGLFVAVGDNDGTDAYLITSSDGITWTERVGGTKNIGLRNACWSPELSIFCSVGNADGADAYILTSMLN
jgi:hypothetical protein